MSYFCFHFFRESLKCRTNQCNIFWIFGLYIYVLVHDLSTITSRAVALRKTSSIHTHVVRPSKVTDKNWHALRIFYLEQHNARTRLQNVPRKTAHGKELNACISAKEKWNTAKVCFEKCEDGCERGSESELLSVQKIAREANIYHVRRNSNRTIWYILTFLPE